MKCGGVLGHGSSWEQYTFVLKRQSLRCFPRDPVTPVSLSSLSISPSRVLSQPCSGRFLPSGGSCEGCRRRAANAGWNRLCGGARGMHDHIARVAALIPLHPEQEQGGAPTPHRFTVRASDHDDQA